MLNVLPRAADRIFWSSPLDNDSEFTPEDPLALDYLAQQVGLWLFPALTTRTTRAQNYAVVLYGLSLAERALAEHGTTAVDHGDALREYFERWERFWALSVLEFHGRPLSRSDDSVRPDRMRGVQGANKVWADNGKPLPLDYPLISRQSELGSLGAYLTSLREYSLVWPGSLKISPAAREIVATFWDDADGRTKTTSYEDYAMAALDPSQRTIPRKLGAVTLGKIGERSRLSALRACGRVAQQGRLWQALFEHARGSTLPLSNLIRRANEKRITEPCEFFVAALNGALGEIPGDVRDKMDAAMAFGDVFVALLDRFNAIYAAATDAGLMVDIAEAAREAFSDDALADLHGVCGRLLEKSYAIQLRSVMHGRAFMGLLTELRSAHAGDALMLLLNYHALVQRERQRGQGWLVEQAGKIVVQRTAYNNYRRDTQFPPLKVTVVRSLLHDLGRLE